MVRIGAHIHDGDPLAAAQADGAEVVQFFLGDPQGWKAPTFPPAPSPQRSARRSTPRASTSTSTRLT